MGERDTFHYGDQARLADKMTCEQRAEEGKKPAIRSSRRASEAEIRGIESAPGGGC